MRSVTVATGCAAAFALGGLSLLFAPAAVVGQNAAISPRGLLVSQLYGTALLGMSAALWTARRAPLGGIYGRALLVGNLTHTFAGTLVCARLAIADGASRSVWIPTLIYLALAATFGWLLFVGRVPVAPDPDA